MNTQLILYPQSYNGQYNTTTNTYTIGSTEFVVDGINFNTINSAPTNQMAAIGYPPSIISVAPPSIINSWYTFRSPLTPPQPSYPIEAGGTLALNMQGANTMSGVYQRLSGLTIGQNYDVVVNVTSVTNEILDIRVLDGLSQIAFQISAAPVTVGTYTCTFTATATDNTIIISTIGIGGSGNILIDSISVVEQGAGTIVTYQMEDGQVICDLYEDENIPLTLSVDDFKNAAEQVQSYSKAFKLPGTKKNNLIFDNIFDVTRSTTGLVFNPYVKTKSILKQDGFILFEGYLRLIDIQDKNGEISYNVNLYSEVVALADMLGEATLADLGFEELEHDYVKSNIKNSWNTSGTGITYTNSNASGFRKPNSTVKYPFCDWNHQMIIANGSTGSAATIGDPELTQLEQAFRPFIQARYLIDRIFYQSGSPFSYTSAFFDTDEFKELYIDFNWGEEPTGASPDRNDTLYRTSDLSTIQWLSQSFEAVQLQTFVSGNNALWANHRFTSDVANLEVSGSVRIQVSNTAASSRGGELGFRKCNQGGAVIEYLATQSYNLAASPSSASLNATFDTVLNAGEYLELVAKQNNAGATEVQISLTQTSYFNVSYNNHSATVESLLIKERGELSQWGLIKGIMTMFNLVSIPDKSNPNNILIEPYEDVFINNANSKQVDWTSKIDVEQVKLTPLTELNRKTTFKFVEDDDDYMFNVYKQSVQGHLYGSKLFDASLSGSGLPTILTGEEEIIAEPFAATVPKPLMTQFADFITPAIYSYNADDGTSEGFANSPRIMYNNGVKTLTSCTYFIPAQNTEAAEQMTDFLQFSHLTDIPTVTSTPPQPTDTNDFHFGDCQLIIPNSNATVNNLFYLYWLPYLNELYNPDTRTMSLKVNLTPGDMNSFNFFDTVFVKNREYRVNKIDYKPGDLATVEFILIT
tara:strand:+ start:224 stop:2989 length:2766 start_codon:yes stop_codon:yes gene_type:complete